MKPPALLPGGIPDTPILQQAPELSGRRKVERFDVIAQSDAPESFILVEVCRDEEAAARHKEVAHYQKWRDTAAPMMAET